MESKDLILEKMNIEDEIEYQINSEVLGNKYSQIKSASQSLLSFNKTKEALDKLKFENSIRIIKLEQLESEIKSLTSGCSNMKRIPEIIQEINEVQKKVDEESLSTLVYCHLKDREIKKTLQSKNKLNQILEHYDKYEKSYLKTKLSKETANQRLALVKFKVLEYESEANSEKELQRNTLDKKCKLKNTIQLRNNEKISTLALQVHQKSLRKIHIKELFSNATSKIKEFNESGRNLHSVREYEREIHSQLEGIRNSLDPIVILKASTPLDISAELIPLFNCSEFQFFSMNRRMDELSLEISKKKLECNTLNTELHRLKHCNKIPHDILSENNENTFESEGNHTENTRGTSEETLVIKIYVKLYSYFTSLVEKMNVVRSNVLENSENLFPDLEELDRDVTSYSKFFKKRTPKLPTSLRSNSKIKTLKVSHVSSISGKNSPELSLVSNKPCKLLQFCGFYLKNAAAHSNYLRNSKFIGLFLNSDDAEGYFRTLVDMDPDRIIVELYVLSHNNLKTMLLGHLQKTCHALLLLKPYISVVYDINKFNFAFQSIPKARSKERGYIAITESARNRKEPKPFALGSGSRKRHIKFSGSQSPQISPQTSMETLREMKEIDHRLRMIKLSELKSSVWSTKYPKLKFPNSSSPKLK